MITARNILLEEAVQMAIEGIEDEHGLIRKFIPSHDFKNKVINAEFNFINNTNLIASRGPSNPEEVNAFFSRFLFQTDKPVTHILSVIYIATRAPYEGGSYRDCWDYAVSERPYETKEYTISIKHLDGKWGMNQSEQVNSIGYEPNPDATSTGYSTNELTITSKVNPFFTRKVEVTTLNIRDNDSLKFYTDDPKADVMQVEAFKEKILRLYELSQSNPLLIHCGSGKGRTGNLILIFRILDSWKEIIALPKPKDKAKKLLDIVDEIRLSRPSLVFTTNQFREAVYIAYELREFMEKKLKDTKVYWKNIFGLFGKDMVSDDAGNVVGWMLSP